MVIVSKNKDILINLEHTKNIYKGADNCTLKANFGNTDGCQLSRYNSPDEMQIAMEMLIDAIGKREVFIMPSDDEVKAKLKAKAGAKGIGENQHHITGKKTKGHGGS